MKWKRELVCVSHAPICPRTHSRELWSSSSRRGPRFISILIGAQLSQLFCGDGGATRWANGNWHWTSSSSFLSPSFLITAISWCNQSFLSGKREKNKRTRPAPSSSSIFLISVQTVYITPDDDDGFQFFFSFLIKILSISLRPFFLLIFIIIIIITIF